MSLVALGAWPLQLQAQLIERRPSFPTPLRPTRTESLERTWSAYPEWLAMFAEILEGNPPYPGQGWFRKGVSRTRFDWKSVSGRLDRDKDGKLEPAEVNGPDEDFRRLDRDRDGRLTASDFDFLDDSRPDAMGVLAFTSNAFQIADRNGDSRVTRPEWDQMYMIAFRDPLIRVVLTKVSAEIKTRFEHAGKTGVNFLSFSDFHEAFGLIMKAEMLAERSATPMVPVRPAMRQVLLRSFFKGDLGSMSPGPALEATAPDFTLTTADGRSEVTLSKLYPTKPVVLIFGNYTFALFRKHAGSLEILRNRYSDRAHFVVVYTRESNPSDGWQSDENALSRVVLRQPRDYRERVDAARTCRKSLGLEIPVLVDGMDDRVSTLYSGLPSRLYLIDRAGRIAYKGGRAPFGFKPAELEQSLLWLLSTEPDPEPTRLR